MKALRSLLFLMLLIASSSVCFAQINIKASYKPSLLTTSTDIDKTLYMHGLAMDVSYNFPIHNHIPLNIETGLGFHYLFHNAPLGESYAPTDYQLSNLYLPVRISYNIKLSNRYSLAPYAGLYGRYFLHYKETTKYSYDQQSTPTIKYPFKGKYAELIYDRFQMGGQIGFTLMADEHFVLEVGYGCDFGNFMSDYSYVGNADLEKLDPRYKKRFHTLTLGLGYRF